MLRNSTTIGSIVSLILANTLGCANLDSSSGNTGEGYSAAGDAEENVATARSALSEIEGPAVERTLKPIRTLDVPGGVYMKSIEQTFATIGTFEQVVHVYQPDANAEPIRIELSAKTSSGVVDSSHTFESVLLTSGLGSDSEVQQPLPNASGQQVYALPTSSQGWYRVSFTYRAVNPGRVLTFKAYDVSGNALKIAWNDPPGVSVQARVKLAVEQTQPVFFKGGAYRNAEPSQYAFADNVTLDQVLLYRRGFDQGRYNFPLGTLAAGEHSLEFSLNASGSAKYWFGVSEKSFDPTGVKTSWAPAQFLYYGAMRTGDYDAWSDGVAFAQGPTLVNGVRPPPVRRGTTFSVALEHPSLGGQWSNAILRIYPLGSGSETNWPTSLPAEYDYRGAIFTSAGPSSRNREHWRVSVPANAAVGRYVLRAMAPNGAQIGSDVLFYVVHNPYPLLASGAIGKVELENYGYDEDEDGVNLSGPYGADSDHFRDHFTAFFDGNAEYGYTPRVKISGSFRRTQDESAFSMLDYAMAASQNTTTEFETMRRLYRLVAQRLKYNRPDLQDDASISFASGGIFPVEYAARYALPGTELPSDQHASGQCFEYGTILTSLARSAGILSRTISSDIWLGGWGNHVFSEAYIANLPQHGGKTGSNAWSPNSDSDPWYVFDATDPSGTGVNPRQWAIHSEAIAPRAHYGNAAKVLLAPDRPFSTVTPALDWDPLSNDLLPPEGVLNVSAAYNAGPEFWLTGSGVAGWLGFGEKDVYRISKETTRAKAVRVRTLPNGGEFLVPKLCVGSVANTPVMPDRCTDAATHYTLPPGESYVVVFNDLDDLPERRNLRGDTVQYLLELEY